MAKVVAREDETLDSMLRRFKKGVMNEGILVQVKNREFYKSKSVKRREKHKAALIRMKSKKHNKY